MNDDRFGKIKIDKGRASGGESADVPLRAEKDSGETVPPTRLEISSAAPEQKAYRRRVRKSRGYGIPLPSRKTVALFSIIPLLLLLYGVGSYFLVPLAIKGMLLQEISEQTGRPVDTGRIVFSPFNLELFVDDMSVGPRTVDRSGGELLSWEKATFVFSLKKIFQGKLVCRQAVFDAISLDLVRDRDTVLDLKMIADLFFSGSAGQVSEYWPSWLLMDEITVDGGRISLDDRITGRVFSIEQIGFYLPSADTREHDTTALPKLSALIDASPFEVNAVRFRNQSGDWSTGFSFAFEDLLLVNFSDMIPVPETGLHLSEGTADLTLDIILPENVHGSQGLVVEGKADLKNVRWSDSARATVLTLPEGRVACQFVPAEKLLRFTNIEFHEPELLLEGNREGGKTGMLNALESLHAVLADLAGGEQAMEVVSFQWNNGRVVMPENDRSGSRTVLDDVIITMNGFATAGYKRLHASADGLSRFTFRARDISSTPVAEFFSEGVLDEGVLKGKCEITGIEPARYPSLLPRSSFSFLKGRGDISFMYEYGVQKDGMEDDREPGGKIYSGDIKTTGFLLAGEAGKIAGGEMMACRDFYFDNPTRTVVCEELELLNSDIFVDAFFSSLKDAAPVTPVGGWKYVINDLQIEGSRVHFTVKGPLTGSKGNGIILSDVHIQATSLNAEEISDNIEASAGTGRKGRLAVNGSYSAKTGQGRVRLDIREMDLSQLNSYITPWLVPKLNSGSFAANGTLQLPERIFTGSARVDDFDAGEDNSARIGWESAVAGDCRYRFEPMLFDVAEVVVQEPSVLPGLSSGATPLQRYVTLPEGKLPETVRIDTIRFVDGRYNLPEPVVYPGYQPLLQGLNGTFSFVDEGDHTFALRGTINQEADFTLAGKASFSDVRSYENEMRNFSLLPFENILRRETGLAAQGATMSWVRKMDSREDGTHLVTGIEIRGVAPDPEMPGSIAPALLVDEAGGFPMDMESEYTRERTLPFLLEQFITRLRHLEVKAAISPRLALKSILPGLDLPENVRFSPGTVRMDNAVSLEGYGELLRTRPFLSLRLQGQFDPVADRAFIQAQLQEEADKKREIENRKRALEKVRILQEEKRRVKKLQEEKPGIVVEEIPMTELTGDLDPLPRVIVQVEPDRLKELARERAQALYSHLVDTLQIDPLRLDIEEKFAAGVSGVGISIHPYVRVEGGQSHDQ